MAKAIIRALKLKTVQALGMTDLHNRREYDRMPDHITQEKTNSNRVYSYDLDRMLKVDNGRLTDKLKERLEDLGITPRKNAVLAVEYVMTASKDLWDKYEPDAYLDYCERFIAERHGEKNVLSVARHFDESNPHIHMVVIPIDEKNKLNCRNFLGGAQKMRQLQDDYFNYMKKWGITSYGIEEREKKKRREPDKYIERTSRVLGDLRQEFNKVKEGIAKTSKNLQESLKMGDLNRVKEWVTEMERRHQLALDELERTTRDKTKVFEKERPKETLHEKGSPPLPPNNRDVLDANKAKTPPPPTPKKDHERGMGF